MPLEKEEKSVKIKSLGNLCVLSSVFNLHFYVMYFLYFVHPVNLWDGQKAIKIEYDKIYECIYIYNI